MARIRTTLSVLGLCLAVVAGPALSSDPDRVKDGAYLFKAAGCLGCHTEEKGPPLAGGRALETPFGKFYGPNITSDPEHGIGAWSLDDLRRALRKGQAPDGRPYYPAFPFTSFTGLTDGDIEDLWHYLQSVPAVDRPNRPHDLAFPFNLRGLLFPWRWLFFRPGNGQVLANGQGPVKGQALASEAPPPSADALWNRGAYLVNAVGHCGECHTPRGLLGEIDVARYLAGNPHGPEGKAVPNITPHPKDGIAAWSKDDIGLYLQLGMDPTGDFAGGAMAEVIRNSTQHLSPADRDAVALYLKSLKGLESPEKDG